MYNTTGEVHHAGVNNEVELAALFTRETPAIIQAAYPGKILTFRHEGGTQKVADIGIFADGVRIAGISVKLHRSGTFDHINTSKVLEYIPCEKLVATIDRLRIAHHGDASAVDAAKTEIKNSTHEEWSSMTSDGIRKLVHAVYERTPEWVVVKETGEISVFRHEEMQELSVFPRDLSWIYVLKAGRAKESRQVWRVKNGVEVNTHLRLRLVTNNGVSALLGLSNANKNSILTLKIQQDSVAMFLTSVTRERIAIA